MGAFIRIGDLSEGHNGFPPTALVYTPVTRTFVDGKGIAVVGARYASHSNNTTTHQEIPSRTIIGSGSRQTFIEGFPIARAGDPIACGDRVGPSTSNSFGS